MISSLQTLSSFYTDNTPAARRALRSTIEKRGLAINERFISAAESVIKVSVCATEWRGPQAAAGGAGCRTWR